MIFGEKELIGACRCHTDIYIYGAGRNASDTFRFLKDRKTVVKGFVVSSLSDNPAKLFGYKVMDIDSFSENEKRDSLILVPMYPGGKAYKDICDRLIGCGICDVWFFPARVMDAMRKEVLELKKKEELDLEIEDVRDVFDASPYFFGEGVPVEPRYCILGMNGPGRQEYHWRCQTSMIKKQEIRRITDVFTDMPAIEEFEKAYGTYHVFPAKGKAAEHGDGRAQYAVYMARSHADRTAAGAAFPGWIIPIQVGAALTDEQICLLKDNTGRNISERNGNYSECTALYWMWKNAPRTDYIGLCHYRRHFNMEEDEIAGLAASDIDALVTTPTFVNETVRTFFSVLAPGTDMERMLDAIRKNCPAYMEAAEEYLSCRFYPPCNLFIMKYDLFLEYMEFLFSVTFEIERFYESRGFYRCDRYMGYIIECLMGIFLMKNRERLKIAYTDMKFYE